MGIDIKTGMSDEAKDILKECLKAFNEIPNKKLKYNKYRDTYQLASELNKIIKE